MKFSIFTPTHDPKFLIETYKSILNQDQEVDFEWIIVPNNKISVKDVESLFITPDKRCKIIQAPENIKGIGALKKFACAQCTGDLFIELDHDDALAPFTFGELLKALEHEPGGFFYSDFVNIKPDGLCETFGQKFGWKTYPINICGKHYTACKAFEPTARSLCQIYYAPNHIRAWSKSAYNITGGHSEDLFVGDDHDLVCRTYLSGIPFVYIPQPLYFYRRYNQNSFIIHNKQVQTIQTQNMHKYLHNLIYKECQITHLPIVKLSTTKNKYFDARCKNILYDINMPPDQFIINEFYSLAENSVGCFVFEDCLQLFPNNCLISLFNQIYKVLVPGGWFLITVPSIDGINGEICRGAFQDLTHKSYWNQNSFWYFTDEKYAKQTPNLNVRFQDVRVFTDYPTDWHKENRIAYITADLCALKGQRQPGICKI